MAGLVQCAKLKTTLVSRTLILCFLFAFCIKSFALDPEPLAQCPAKHLTGIVVGTDSDVWVSSEDNGLWRFKDGKWLACKDMSGLGIHAAFTSIAIDAQGRVWAGTFDSGVYVYNGKEWKNYGVLNGPLHARINSITVSSKGIVGVSHAAGVSLWNPSSDSWSDLTALDGLPPGGVAVAAFDSEENLWIALECGGVAFAAAGNAYRAPVLHQGLWFWDSLNRTHAPMAASGRGLPGNLVNTLAVMKNGDILAGTTNGLGIRHIPAQTEEDGKMVEAEPAKDGNDNDGKTVNKPETTDSEWFFIRSSAYRAGLRFEPGQSYAEKIDMSFTLPEDYVTAFLEDGDGVWIGFRKMGVFYIDLKEMKLDRSRSFAAKGEELYRITSLAKDAGGRILASSYGTGLLVVGQSAESVKSKIKSSEPVASASAYPAFPSGATAFTPQAAQNPKRNASEKVQAEFLYDDWTTKGDWCELYGHNYAIHCAANAPVNNVVFPNIERLNQYGVFGFVGPVRHETGVMRSYVEWVNDLGRRDVLYQPTSFTRTMAEWDDNGEEFSAFNDGPDLWIHVRMPEDEHQLALYFFNPNSRDGANSERDFLIEIFEDPLHHKTFSFNDACTVDYAKVLAGKVLARARVHHFANGVYKVFALKGSNAYYVRINRSHSYNTILSGVFIAKYYDKQPALRKKQDGTAFVYHGVFPLMPDPGLIDESKVRPETLSLWKKSLANTPFQYAFRAYALRSAKKDAATDKTMLELLKWQLPVWTDARRKAFDETMVKCWDAHQEQNRVFRSSFFKKHSPGVVPFTPDELFLMELEKIDWREYRKDSKVKPARTVEELKKFLMEKYPEKFIKKKK